MNFQSWSLKPPIKIMMINPLVHASELTIVKILTGYVFGMDQLIDVILLVYSNEIPAAEAFIQELFACNFGCVNTIVATSDLPSITDADVFMCITNFTDPNALDYDNLDSEDNFDSFYLYIKVALSLRKSAIKLNEEENELNADKSKIVEKKPKPVFIGDGLIVLDILNTMGAEDMADGYFSAGCIPALARSTLAEYLKVRCSEINTIYVWAANHEYFHAEFEKPYITSKMISHQKPHDLKSASTDFLNGLKLDSSQFNESWMRKEFIQKIKEMTSKNTTGPIFRAWQMNRCLLRSWEPRICGEKKYLSLGVISDGSLRTIKGLPYILPVIMSPDGSWEVNHRFGNMPHLIQEIKRFNKVAAENHRKLVKYCHKFLKENIINQNFVPIEGETESSYFSTTDQSIYAKS